MKRLADSYYRKRADQIDAKYQNLHSDPLKFVMMRDSDKSIYVDYYIQWAGEKVDARFQTYKEAFVREKKIPTESDLSEMSWAFDEIISGVASMLPGELEARVKRAGHAIIQNARRDIHIFSQEMKLTDLKPIGEVRVVNSKDQRVRWSQLHNPTSAGVFRIHGLGDVEISQEDISAAQEIGGDPWVELCDTTTFGSKIRKFSLGLFTPA